MESGELPFPYSLPIWRSSHRAWAPDGKLEAAIDHAYEQSMGNPTLGELVVSDGLSLGRCSPSFLWSDCSRYLAVAQLDNVLGLFFASRMIVADTATRAVFRSPRYRAWLQPESFVSGALRATISPFRNPRAIRWDVPGDLVRFSRAPYPVLAPN
jgi:hypothetical protein